MTLLSPNATELAELGLDRGMEQVLAPGGTLTAFLLTEQGGDRRLHEFETERPGQALAVARYFLRAADGIERAAVIWDGFVPKHGRRVDAVLAEIYTRGDTASELFARCYRPASRLRGVQALGGTVRLGTGHPLF